LFFPLELEYYVKCVDIVDSDDEDTGDVIVEENIENNFLVVALETKTLTYGFSSLVAEIQVSSFFSSGIISVKINYFC
jgi:hypothetical protein